MTTVEIKVLKQLCQEMEFTTSHILVAAIFEGEEAMIRTMGLASIKWQQLTEYVLTFKPENNEVQK